MKAINSWLLIAVTNILLPIAILIFAKGFFPYKPVFPGLAVLDATSEPPPPAPFEKVIFMVVDALRSDFVFSENSGFKFTQSLIRSGSAVPFTAHATSPTITMPRVKALTTGSIPSFLDVILNFAESDTSSTLANQDSWLAQIRQRDGKITMFGDDTWLKLFPGMFARSDGTSSFFVSDFTEVDNNVTRHHKDELLQTDWDAMIMHYLGLDHIGHKSGPRSPYMKPKQEEMDNIVQEFYNALIALPHLESTLFVLAGDHGMNDAGNHGGSAPGETSPALVLISPKFEKAFPGGGRECPALPKEEFDFYTTVEQSDIVPTLAGLLGFPVPKNNLGVFIPSLLGMWKASDRVELMLRNAQQLLAIVRAAYPDFDDKGSLSDCIKASTNVEELSCWWKKSQGAYENFKMNGVNQDVTLELLSVFSTRCQDVLSMAASNYNLELMTTGTVLTFLSSILSIFGIFRSSENSRLANLFFPLSTLLYGVMMFASSYVEEEHHFWYWVASGWFVCIFVKGHKKIGALPSLAILTLLRVARRWNQTGQKHAGSSDISKDFLQRYPSILWFLVIVAYLVIFLRLSNRTFRRAGREVAFVFAFVVMASALAFKFAFAAQDTPELIPWDLVPVAEWLEDIPLVNLARSTFGAILVGILYTISFEIPKSVPYNNPTSLNSAVVFMDFIIAFLVTQTRLVNIPLFLLLQLVAWLLGTMRLSATEITISTMILSHFSFFAFGGANAISSVDLSNAYNGVSGYNVVIVAILTLVSNWIGPIYWSCYGIILLTRRRVLDKSAYLRHTIILSSFYCITVAFVMVACTVLRTHLFIWTVFSPKFLYSMAWVLGYHILINLGLGGIMGWAGKRCFI
ncbi:uncharacterized protein LAJ45_06111 [Morchella importuna]|uniref:GPI ethanolamine phosphate transferase 2 n=1 Tax=Morchella conica CCBAS932 TaxID=1392247 RepID=A0A3N4L3I5_9PEZI|nr:uncharacterized protein LAJ45_06111 [Morchella importuna]KAH8149958.1 hypothetical protein LAJ45_06111 [Morchella importuna]RPB16049.1 alkaline phosphatase-like protein [Morchella conica CCBAS932]